MDSLKELDVRANKKQVCKISEDVIAALKIHRCMIRGQYTCSHSSSSQHDCLHEGGVVAKGKKKKGDKKK
jgi:hypothetical protein